MLQHHVLANARLAVYLLFQELPEVQLHQVWLGARLQRYNMVQLGAPDLLGLAKPTPSTIGRWLTQVTRCTTPVRQEDR
jgi:hypothetical protein